MMDAAAFGAVLRGAEHDLFRMETLNYYEPDAEDFARYVAGEAADPESVRPWLERLRAEKERGLCRRRVHIVKSPVPRYVAYECEWPYARNISAGEQIRILDRTEVIVPPAVEPVDFYLVDRRDVVLMHYDRGVFEGAELLDPGLRGYYLAAAGAAWDAAEPLETWWARHPEYHRDQHMAA